MLPKSLAKISKILWVFRSTVILIFAPICSTLIFAFYRPTQENKCLYVVLVMSVYWVTEVLPLPVTALLPLVLYPVLGIMEADVVAHSFMSDSLLLFMGGYFIAIAFEYSDLHRRLALKSLLMVGGDVKKILFVLMSATSFLSMWISNAAATGMMLPIIEAILIELIKGDRNDAANEQNRRRRSSILAAIQDHPDHPINNRLSKMKIDELDETRQEMEQEDAKKIQGVYKRASIVAMTFLNPMEKEVVLLPEQLNKKELNLCKMLILAVCYASSIGGIGTITGCPSNIIIFGYMEKTYGKNTGLSYLSWCAYCVPVVVINTVVAWAVVLLFYFGIRGFKSTVRNNNVSQVVRMHYEKLGRMNFQQWSVMMMFFVLISLWVFHSPQFMPGWSDLFTTDYVSGATAAMLMTCLLFILPNKMPQCKQLGPSGRIPDPPGPLMTWKYLQAKFPWDMVLLIGGGMAMADGISSSGLSLYIGKIFSAFNSLQPWQMGIVVILIGTVITEAASNATIATIMTPVICAAAIEMKINPLYLVMAGGVAINLAFTLPIGTPANAVIFSMGLIQVVDMIKLGLVMKIHTTLTAILAANSWGRLLFDYNDFPQWARNTTSVAKGNFTL